MWVKDVLFEVVFFLTTPDVVFWLIEILLYTFYNIFCDANLTPNYLQWINVLGATKVNLNELLKLKQ